MVDWCTVMIKWIICNVERLCCNVLHSYLINIRIGCWKYWINLDQKSWILRQPLHFQVEVAVSSITNFNNLTGHFRGSSLIFYLTILTQVSPQNTFTKGKCLIKCVVILHRCNMVLLWANLKCHVYRLGSVSACAPFTDPVELVWTCSKTSHPCTNLQMSPCQTDGNDKSKKRKTC